MRFKQFTMHSSPCTIGQRKFCRGGLSSPVRGFVILNAMKNLRGLVEVGERCE